MLVGKLLQLTNWRTEQTVNKTVDIKQKMRPSAISPGRVTFQFRRLLEVKDKEKDAS